VERGWLASVRLRYAKPESEDGGSPRIREIEESLDARDLYSSFRSASPRFQLDAGAAEFAEILRHSYWAKESRIADLLPVVRSAAAHLRDDSDVQEFVRLVERAVDLSDKLSPEEQWQIQGR